MFELCKKLCLAAAWGAAAIGGEVVFEQDFNHVTADSSWYLPPGFRFDPAAGLSGTGALVYDKSDPNIYQLASWTVPLRADEKYSLSVMVRVSGVDREKFAGPVSRIIAVQFTNRGEFCGGAYTYGTLPEDEWQEVVLPEILPPTEFTQATVTFYLQGGVSGRIAWDNLVVERIGAVAPEIYDLAPSNLTIRADHAKLTFRIAAYGADNRVDDFELKASWPGGEAAVGPDANGDFTVAAAGLAEGLLPVATELIHRPTGAAVARQDFNYFVDFREYPPGAVYIDAHARTIVDGKPFLPVGMFGGGLDEAMCRRLSEAGANAVMPYFTCFARERIGDQFDLAEQYGLKALFCVIYQIEGNVDAIRRHREAEGIDNVLKAWVDEYKDHPALLGWFISDENPLDQIPRLRDMREMINARDPDHPVVTLTYIPRHFPAFARTGDVLAVDNYPITGRSSSLGLLPELVADGVRTMPAVWVVPQAMNWRVYRSDDSPENPFRFPTTMEMQSMALAAAVNGAKGFLFYNYDDIFRRGEAMQPGSAEADWQQVVPVLRLLRELEGYLLSLEPAPPAESSGDRVLARAWRDGGKTMLAIVSPGPGDCDAEVFLAGEAGLKSRFGLTENLGGGRYRFRGTGACSDILEE